MAPNILKYAFIDDYITLNMQFPLKIAINKPICIICIDIFILIYRFHLLYVNSILQGTMNKCI